LKFWRGAAVAKAAETSGYRIFDAAARSPSTVSVNFGAHRAAVAMTRIERWASFDLH
jgi:hypothetical protein